MLYFYGMVPSQYSDQFYYLKEINNLLNINLKKFYCTRMSILMFYTVF